MCFQGEQKKWVKKRLKNLCFEKVARNCKESKLEAIPPPKETKMVSLLGLSIKVMQFLCTYIKPTIVLIKRLSYMDSDGWAKVIYV